MKKSTTIVLAVGLFIGAIALAALGLVVKDRADFSKDYVRAQLAERAIVFTPEANLLPQQKKIDCLVENAGQPLVNGHQAECYAKYQIGIDLTLVDEGHTYFESHYNGYLARVAAAEALVKAPDAPETAALVAKADDIQRKADDLLAGEATRGLLLSAYGFSQFGVLGHQAARIIFVLAGLVFIAAIGVLVLGLRKKSAPAVVSGIES